MEYTNTMAVKILLVEDGDTQRRFLKDGLEKSGYAVEVAENGAEGYKKFFEFDIK